MEDEEAKGSCDEHNPPPRGRVAESQNASNRHQLDNISGHKAHLTKNLNNVVQNSIGCHWKALAGDSMARLKKARIDE